MYTSYLHSFSILTLSPMHFSPSLYSNQKTPLSFVSNNDNDVDDDVLLQLLAVVEVHLLCLQLAFGSHTPSAVMHLLTF